MKELQEFIAKHSYRGECQCGKCCDKGPDREAPKHSVNVHFFWVAAMFDPDREEFIRLVRANYPHLDRLGAGPSFIEIGGELGDQGLALLFMGLGELLDVWTVITPKKLGMEGKEADDLAGQGFVMISGFRDEALTRAVGERHDR